MRLASLYSTGHQGRLKSAFTPAFEALPERPALRCRAAYRQARALSLALGGKAVTASSDMATTSSSGLSDEQIQRFQTQGRIPTSFSILSMASQLFGFSADTCMTFVAALLVVFFVCLLDHAKLGIQVFSCWRALQLLRKCRGYVGEQSSSSMALSPSLSRCFPPSPR